MNPFKILLPPKKYERTNDRPDRRMEIFSGQYICDDAVDGGSGGPQFFSCTVLVVGKYGKRVQIKCNILTSCSSCFDTFVCGCGGGWSGQTKEGGQLSLLLVSI